MKHIGLMQFLKEFFDSSQFMPHGHCYLWYPQILWLHVVSDAFIALAYFSIPVSLLYILKRREDTPFSWLVGLFGSFIMLCGTTHIMGIWTIWHPDYAIDGVIKALTALASVPTAYVIWRMMPQLVLLKTPAQLEKLNDELRVAKDEVEKVVEVRTGELTEALGNMEKASNAKSEFLTNMSHELRTPMHAITGITDILKRRYSNDEQKELLDTLEVSATTLLQLIDDILDISKIENAQVKLENISFNLKGVIEGVINLNKVKLRQKQVAIRNDYADGLSENYMGDPVRVKQIVMNLVSNAVKFTDSGEIVISVVGKNDGVQLTVRDSGVGIDKEFLKTIFNKFSQEDASTTRKYGGSGVGLSIVKSLVELMGGEIEVRSEKGRGAEFVVMLPLVAVT